MPISPLSKTSQSQRDRLAFIELRLRFIGEIRRRDLVTRFRIQAAAATRDIAQYKEIAPYNIDYNAKSKVYVRADWFRPTFEFSPERVLTWISLGFGDGEPLRWKSPIFCEHSPSITRVNLDVLSVLTCAIHRQSVIEMTYRSLSNGVVTREIFPLALAESVHRWYLRAFDRHSGEFSNFALGRIVDARFLAGEIAEHELQDQDIQWNRIVELELVPHPANVQHPDTIESEYGMEDGLLRIRIRAAMAGYFLRDRNVDCSENHSLKGAEFRLWLRNRQALYGISHLLLAPGYDAQKND
jgi:predicted DNA-binding transcriptional regulator YafY